jgi:rhamnosyltransferase
MKNNFAACVILYNPKEEDISNILTYINKVKTVYIFDNTEGKSNENLFQNFENASYFWDNENKGIAIRLNEGCKKAIENGFEYLLTMDQDSSFLEENLDVYFKDILNFSNKEQVAIYNLEYDKEYLSVKKDQVIFEKKDHLITSASVMNLKLFSNIGGFDENLFIDGVDIDYCYAAMAKGFDNIQFKNNYFKHSLGEPVRKGSVTSLYLIKKNVRIHSAIRVYYMKRNMLYLEEKYGAIFPEFIDKQKKIYKRHIKRCIKYSDTFLKVIQYRNKAIADFKNKKMGKFIPF